MVMETFVTYFKLSRNCSKLSKNRQCLTPISTFSLSNNTYPFQANQQKLTADQTAEFKRKREKNTFSSFLKRRLFVTNDLERVSRYLETFLCTVLVPSPQSPKPLLNRTASSQTGSKIKLKLKEKTDFIGVTQ